MKRSRLFIGLTLFGAALATSVFFQNCAKNLPTDATLSSKQSTATSWQLVPRDATLQTNQTMTFSVSGTATSPSFAVISGTGKISPQGLFTASGTAGNVEISLTDANGIAQTATINVVATSVAPSTPSAPTSPGETPTPAATPAAPTGPQTESMVAFVAQNSGKCLDIYNAGVVNGNKIQQWDCNGNTQQKFTLNSNGQLIDQNSGKCIDITNANSANGTMVQLWDCNGYAQQKWTYTSSGQLIGLGGKCLDVKDASTANGALIQIWDCTGGANQKFLPATN